MAGVIVIVAPQLWYGFFCLAQYVEKGGIVSYTILTVYYLFCVGLVVGLIYFLLLRITYRHD